MIAKNKEELDAKKEEDGFEFIPNSLGE